MTQAEVDARLCAINQEFAEKRYELNKNYHTRRAFLKAELEVAYDNYQANRLRLNNELREVMLQRNELRRQGLEMFNPEMERNRLHELNIQDTLTTVKEEYTTAKRDHAFKMTDNQNEWENGHHELRKQQHDAVCHVYEEYHNQSINQSINQSMTQADAYANALQPES